jgi:hypothetical protein
MAAHGRDDPNRGTTMPFAMKDFFGYSPAVYRGATIKETGVADRYLGPSDTHFGRTGFLSYSLKVPSELRGLGPRVVDMCDRGGRVAETLWEEWQSNPASGPHSAALKQFLVAFDEVGKASASGPRSEVYPPGASINGNPVAGERKYAPGARDKTMASLPGANGAGSDATRSQVGTRWSKVALEVTLLNGGGVHFHLDGMGDIGTLLDKQGEHNYDTTTRELRYVKRNWDRFKDHTTFYNGFHEIGPGEYAAVVVETPWA